MAPLARPLACRDGPAKDDTRTLHDIRYRVRRLLEHQAVLPPALAAMLRHYQHELADTIQRHIADGTWC